MIEIERKFLVNDLDKALSNSQKEISIFQGYISVDPERTVRLRITGEKAFLTIKGQSSKGGTSRIEWENSINVDEANRLLPLCCPSTINKTRYHVHENKQLFEIDVFEGPLKGLVIAEIELNHPDQKVILPSWIGREVTGDKSYYNSHLAIHGLPN